MHILQCGVRECNKKPFFAYACTLNLFKKKKKKKKFYFFFDITHIRHAHPSPADQPHGPHASHPVCHETHQAPSQIRCSSPPYLMPGAAVQDSHLLGRGTGKGWDRQCMHSITVAYLECARKRMVNQRAAPPGARERGDHLYGLAHTYSERARPILTCICLHSFSSTWGMVHAYRSADCMCLCCHRVRSSVQCERLRDFDYPR
jgi:hypothetical protein